MQLLDNVVQHYDWGSREAIAQLTGRPVPSPQPEAELWMGAHPAAPSRVHETHESLLDLVGKEPDALLGAQVRRTFGGFPFLLKVLAAEQPLSIQAHPSKAQAEAGYADEEARGVPRTAPHRNYKDANHKPELLCALSRFEALCGFRQPDELVQLLDRLAVPELTRPRARGAAGMRETFRSVMERTGEVRARLVSAVRDACMLHASTEGPFTASLRWSLRLAALYPGDLGAVSALFMNHVVLEPGQAIYLPAGNLHAYLSGVGIELMASSDNVLRGGLTPKHVDLGELLRVVDFEAGPVALAPIERPRAGEFVYRTPAPDFRLSRLELTASALTFDVQGPEILFCLSGTALARPESGEALALGRGDAALVWASERSYSLTGDGVVFRASIGPIELAAG